VELWKEISNFLLDNNELSIENFGKFEVTTEDTTFDKEKNIILPVRKIIKFKDKAKSTSNEFIDYLKGKYDLDEKSLKKSIENQVKNAIDYLNKGEKLNLPGFGYFIKRTKNIELITPEKYSVSPEHYGLGEVKLPQGNIAADAEGKTKKKSKKAKEKAKVAAAAATEKPKKITEKPKKEKAVKKTKPQTKKTKSTTPPQPVYNKPTEEKSKKSVKLGLWLSIAAIVILLVVFYKPILNKINSITKPTTVKIHTKTTNDQSATEENQDTVEYAQMSQNNNVQADTQTTEETTQTTQPQSNDQNLLNEFSSKAKVSLGSGYKKYYLIVGSFTYIENARKLKSELTNAGYPAEILTSDIEKYRVTIGGFNDLKNAVKAYQNYIIQNPGKDAWLLINE